MIYAGPALPGQPGATASTEPKHRAERTVDIWPSMATCTDTKSQHTARCVRTYCPRHFPANYADAMARHATDSI